jgi:DNA-directed RNA polymerase subunit alpha
VDPRQYIASLTKKGNLEMEILIARGQNYFTSEKLDSKIPERFLAVDAVFMPVTKVNFFVETSRSSLSFELESLILEIWTNGSITPDEALTSSSEILENTFGLLKVTNALSAPSAPIDSTVQEEKSEHLETIFIEELELSVRAYNCLKRANVHTLSDLLQYSAEDLLEFKNFGRKSADEVCENLKTRFDLDLQK